MPCSCLMPLVAIRTARLVGGGLKSCANLRAGASVELWHCDSLIEGMRYASFADLRQFCYRVASVMGLMMSHVIGFRDQSWHRHTAHQYLRDCG